MLHRFPSWKRHNCVGRFVVGNLSSRPLSSYLPRQIFFIAEKSMYFVRQYLSNAADSKKMRETIENENKIILIFLILSYHRPGWGSDNFHNASIFYFQPVLAVINENPSGVGRKLVIEQDYRDDLRGSVSRFPASLTIAHSSRFLPLWKTVQRATTFPHIANSNTSHSTSLFFRK